MTSVSGGTDWARIVIEGACNEPRPWNWKNGCRRRAGHSGAHHTWDPRTGTDKGRHPRAPFVEAWPGPDGPVREVRELRGHGAYVSPARTDRMVVSLIREAESQRMAGIG